MSASKEAKKLGVKNLTEVAEMTDQSLQTLRNWHRNKPKLFRVVIAGCVATKEAGK